MPPKLDLIGIIVRDMPAALNFYRQLGWDIPAAMDTEGQEKRTDGKELAEVPGMWRFLWLLFMQLGRELARDHAEYTRVQDAFAVAMEPMFWRWWKRCEQDARRRLKACLSGSVAVAGLADRERRGYRALAWRGLLDERDGEFTISGDAWQAFVQDA